MPVQRWTLLVGIFALVSSCALSHGLDGSPSVRVETLACIAEEARLPLAPVFYELDWDARGERLAITLYNVPAGVRGGLSVDEELDRLYLHYGPSPSPCGSDEPFAHIVRVTLEGRPEGLSNAPTLQLTLGHDAPDPSNVVGAPRPIRLGWNYTERVVRVNRAQVTPDDADSRQANVLFDLASAGSPPCFDLETRVLSSNTEAVVLPIARGPMEAECEGPSPREALVVVTNASATNSPVPLSYVSGDPEGPVARSLGTL